MHDAFSTRLVQPILRVVVKIKNLTCDLPRPEGEGDDHVEGPEASPVHAVNRVVAVCCHLEGEGEGGGDRVKCGEHPGL